MKARNPLILTLAGLIGATLLCSPLVYAQSSPKGGSTMTTEHATAQPKQTAHSSKQTKKKSTTHASKKKSGEKGSSQMH